MKKSLIALLFVITSIGYSQEITLDVKIKLETVLINDSNTLVYIHDITDSINIYVPVDNLTIHLMPNTEYSLVFVREGYISKMIYVSTDNMNCNSGTYRINSSVDLKKGSKSTVIKAGNIWYDSTIKSFKWHITNATLIKPVNMCGYMRHKF